MGNAGKETSVQSAAFAMLLLDSGVVTAAQLKYANAARERNGTPIDETLVSQGMVREADIARVMSGAWRLPRASLGPVATNDELIRRRDRDLYLDENWLPLYRIGTKYLVATARMPDASRTRHIENILGAPVSFAVATSWEIKNAVLRIFHSEIADDAANELWKQNPKLSARIVFSRSQAIGIPLFLVALIILGIFYPIPVLIGVIASISLIFLAGTVFKFRVAMIGAKYDVVERITSDEVAALEDEDLPIYTVLVPVFRESNIVGQLVKNLGSIDYPKAKLEIFVLIEEEDDETFDAFNAADPPEYFHVVRIPRGHPQTKPRACNVGLTFAQGEYLVIFDAEDTPDPDQLKKAIIAFQRGGEKTVCVQASLNYFNATENVLTRMFTLEYSYWFDYMLAGLDAADLPIPLGGTSNHFRTEALVSLGGWDPYNVTEDADLGIRASALGYRVGVINSTTMEEANTSVPNFIRQRSRWIKGYMQTSLVHARRPLALLREIGIVRFASFMLLIAGTPATFLGVIPLYILALVIFFVPTAFFTALFPGWLLLISLANFLIGNSVMVYLSMMGPYKRGAFNLTLWALFNPVYWLLHSIAAYKGLWQLITNPHYWEKTNHGLTKQENDLVADAS